MPPAEFPCPQSAARAMCPPHANTAVALSGVSVTRMTVSDWLAVRLPCVTYCTPVIVPPNRVITRWAAGSALNRVAGCPATGDPAVLGAGMAKVLMVFEAPATPDSGFTISAGCPKPACDSRRWKWVRKSMA